MIKFTKIKKELVRDLVGINDPFILVVCNFLKYLNKKNDCGNACLALANAGNAEAQFIISKVLQWGLMCSQDLEESLKWCRKSADQNYIPAYIELADFDDYAIYDYKNNKVAMDLYHKAALSEDIVALNRLGFFYSYGYYIKKNIPKAIEYYKKAIKLKNNEAMYNLSQLYINEPECLDVQKGIKLLIASADKDFPDAHFMLGHMYWSGDNGLQKNKDLYFKHIKMVTTIRNKIIRTCLEGLI